MTLASLPAFLGLLVLVASGLGGALVWTYNRTIANMREVPAKKFLATGALPAAVATGAWGAWQVVTARADTPTTLIIILFALLGVAMILRGVRVELAYARRLAASQRESLPVDHEVINWRRLPFGAAPILRLLAPINDVGRLMLHRRVVRVPDLPSSFEGYRIAHITDWHIHHTLTDEWFRTLVAHTNALGADITLFGGDTISKRKHLPRVSRLMDGLHAPDGVFAIRGNHDFWKSPRRVLEQLQRAGITVVSNDAIVLRRGSDQLPVLFFEEPYKRLTPEQRRRLSALPLPRIGMVHTPDAYPLAEKLGCSVCLAGHSHGGQVRLPIFGVTLSNVTLGAEYALGPGRWRRMVTFTSPGQGAFFPFRWRVPPEIVLLELRRA